MAKPRDDRQKDLLRPALEDIIDFGHPLARLAREIDWTFLDNRFASVCAPRAGQLGCRRGWWPGCSYERGPIPRVYFRLRGVAANFASVSQSAKNRAAA